LRVSADGKGVLRRAAGRVGILVGESTDALELLRSAIGQQEHTRLMASGATMTEDEAIEEVHSLE
jgi:hypothetical protein